LPGIVRCHAKDCGELFITAAHIRSTIAELFAEGRPTKWLGTPEAEQERRRKHGEYHAERGEALRDLATRRFVLPPSPERVKTAADFGF